jgi:hypothetical protein
MGLEIHRRGGSQAAFGVVDANHMLMPARFAADTAGVLQRGQKRMPGEWAGAGQLIPLGSVELRKIGDDTRAIIPGP